MKKKIIILNENQYCTDKLLKNIEVEMLNIEIMEVSLEDLDIFKSIVYKNNKMIKCIQEILDLLGVPNYKIGYKYIIDAIMIWNEYQYIKNLKIYSIYENIALKYNKSIYSVEKAIRNCIDYCFTYGNLKELNKLFVNDISINTGKIESKKFISKISQYIK